MKNLHLYLFGLFLLFAVGTKADAVPVSSSSTQELANIKRADELVTRLNEIKSMDVSNLSSAEKRSMRKEVRSIKAELKTLGDGVYLSVGALIIIILLLILLL